MQQFQPHGFQSAVPASVSSEAGERAFFATVYGLMCGALAITGVAAWMTYTTPALFDFAMNSFWVLAIGMLAMAWLVPANADRLPMPVNVALFGVFSVLMGMMCSWIFIAYELGSIFEIFVLTAGIFGGMSVYGLTTKNDLTSWGSFLMMGLFGIIIAGIINIFMRNDMAAFVITCIGVVVFVGFTAYDTQRLRVYYASSSGTAQVGALAVVGAFTLYLNFVNLFLKLLRLFGRRR